jgi:hypothetical protein
MRKLLACMLMLGVVSCGGEDNASSGPRARAETVVEPETRVDTVPQEEPAVARSQWRAATDSARAMTGNLRVSLEGARGGPVIFAFANGITITAQPYDVTPANSRSGVGGQSLAAVLGGDPRVDVYLYRVENERISASAVRGGLCGEASTRHLAVSEFVDGSGRWVFKIAAFSGEARPAAGADPGFCASYGFVAQ